MPLHLCAVGWLIYARVLLRVPVWLVWLVTVAALLDTHYALRLYVTFTQFHIHTPHTLPQVHLQDYTPYRHSRLPRFTRGLVAYAVPRTLVNVGARLRFIALRGRGLDTVLAEGHTFTLPLRFVTVGFTRLPVCCRLRLRTLPVTTLVYARLRLVLVYVHYPDFACGLLHTLVYTWFTHGCRWDPGCRSPRAYPHPTPRPFRCLTCTRFCARAPVVLDYAAGRITLRLHTLVTDYLLPVRSIVTFGLAHLLPCGLRVTHDLITVVRLRSSLEHSCPCLYGYAGYCCWLYTLRFLPDYQLPDRLRV